MRALVLWCLVACLAACLCSTTAANGTPFVRCDCSKSCPVRDLTYLTIKRPRSSMCNRGITTVRKDVMSLRPPYVTYITYFRCTHRFAIKPGAVVQMPANSLFPHINNYPVAVWRDPLRLMCDGTLEDD